MTPARSTPSQAQPKPLPLSRLVGRFATSPEKLAAERSAMPSSARARLERILQEIDETVLPCRLRVICENAPPVDLAVSNRRLVDIHASECTSQASDTRTAPEERFAAELLELSARAKAVTALGDLEDGTMAETEQSCSVEGLRRALRLDRKDAGLAALRDHLDQLSHAHLWWDSDTKKLQFRGQADLKEFLRAHAAEMRRGASTEKASLTHNTNDVTGFAAPLSDDLVLIAALDGHKGYVCVAPRISGLRALTAWQIAANPS